MADALVTGIDGVVGAAIAERLRAEGFLVGTIGDEDLLDRGKTMAAAKKLPPPSVLVVAPHLHDAAPFGEMPADRWRRLLQAHLGSTTNACAAIVPGMVEAGRGTVVTTTSWLALDGVAGEAYAAAATGTILAFTKSFALEVAPRGVRVNCVTAGRPADVADTVMFLIRDGDFFVGQVLTPGAP